jgi:hypothetical protein
MYNQTGLIVHTLGSLETTCTCCVSILADLCNSLDRFDCTYPWFFINNLYMLCVYTQGYVQSNLSKLLQRSTSIDTQHVQVVSKEPRVCTVKPV